MDFKIAFHTDIGPVKTSNQDSMCIKEAYTKNGDVLMAVMCDGMGGLEKGEVASREIIDAIGEWFEKKLPYLLAANNIKGAVKTSWNQLIKEENRIIGAYGKANRLQLGSTITAMLILPDGEYIIAHVGDSRAYRITNNSIDILTDDQTVVAREVRQGRMTQEQAEKDSRRNVLLQCVGASRIVEPAFYEGKAWPNECFMLCSDGFRHELSSKEIAEAFKPAVNGNEGNMRQNLVRLIDENIKRGETDNISAMLIRTL